jgi:hypothetical protein
MDCKSTFICEHSLLPYPLTNRILTYTFIPAWLLLLVMALFGCQDTTSSRTAANGIDTTGISSSGAVLLQGQVIVIPPPALLSRIIR